MSRGDVALTIRLTFWLRLETELIPKYEIYSDQDGR